MFWPLILLLIIPELSILVRDGQAGTAGTLKLSRL